MDTPVVPGFAYEEFVHEAFPKIARLSRDCTVSEKIDGTCAQVFIPPDGLGVYAGSKNRWITPADDNFGFAAWVQEHQQELLTMGPGRHFGEWWGRGIQRGYDLKEKRWSVFNTSRWCAHDATPVVYPSADPRVPPKTQTPVPACVHVVPVLYHGVFDMAQVTLCLEHLRLQGSRASPGFMRAEGIIMYHSAANTYFKKTLEHDDVPKTRAMTAGSPSGKARDS